MFYEFLDAVEIVINSNLCIALLSLMFLYSACFVPLIRILSTIATKGLTDLGDLRYYIVRNHNDLTDNIDKINDSVRRIEQKITNTEEKQ